MRFWPQLTYIQASHNPKVAGSNPAPRYSCKPCKTRGFCVDRHRTAPKLLPKFCLPALARTGATGTKRHDGLPRTVAQYIGTCLTVC
jgi:hypothetical protein